MNVVSQINIYLANKVNVNVTCMHQQQDRESLPVKDQCSTTVPRNQLLCA